VSTETVHIYYTTTSLPTIVFISSLQWHINVVLENTPSRQWCYPLYVCLLQKGAQSLLWNTGWWQGTCALCAGGCYSDIAILCLNANANVTCESSIFPKTVDHNANAFWWNRLQFDKCRSVNNNWMWNMYCIDKCMPNLFIDSAAIECLMWSLHCLVPLKYIVPFTRVSLRRSRVSCLLTAWSIQ
jgi:hypothetical protein